MAERRKAPAKQAHADSKKIDDFIAQFDDWRGTCLNELRRIVLNTDPRIVEEWKWETPVWSCNGVVCTGEVYKAAVKTTFAKGASLPDPDGLFTSSLDAKVRRAIDFREHETIDQASLQSLIRAAIAINVDRPAKKKKVKLLTGGNPQIAKGDGDGPVQDYIDAMPDWKSEIGRQIDAIASKALPNVRKAVKWNSPFYGLTGRGWLIGIHCMTKYVKVAFFNGASFHPLPPDESKQKDVRYLNIYEGDSIDEKQMIDWLKQAAKLPGWLTADIQ
jgi:hypothetical protein